MMVTRMAAAAAALALAGCAGGGFVGYERAVTGGGAGLPETVARASTAEVTPPGRRMLGLAVRTYARDAAGAIVEVPGTCTVTGGTLGASLATPGRLVVPDLGPDAPVLTARCTAQGMTGSGAVEPAFAWAEDGGGAAARLAWGGGPWRGGPRTGPMRYPDLMVGVQPR
jgi:hypothetical protein